MYSSQEFVCEVSHPDMASMAVARMDIAMKVLIVSYLLYYETNVVGQYFLVILSSEDHQ